MRTELPYKHGGPPSPGAFVVEHSMDHFVAPIRTAFADNNPASPVCTAYDPFGAYLNFSRMGVMGWKIVADDGAGVPINDHAGGKHYNPVTIAHYALELFSRIVEGKAGAEEEARLRRVIDHLLAMQLPDGGWPFSFDHMFFPGRTEMLAQPWYSALSQGMVLSALVRFWHRFGGADTSVIARALDIVGRDVAAGGVCRTAFDRYAFYEEYPTTPPSFVLNGFLYCLLGLYDCWAFDGNARARALFDAGADALASMLPFYDLGDGSSYDLTHITSRVEGPNKARPAYHRLHVMLLSTLDTLCAGRFARVVARWDMYLKGNVLRSN